MTLHDKTRREELRLLLAKASPGQWRHLECDPGMIYARDRRIALVGWGHSVLQEHAVFDARAIAAAHNLLPALLDAADRLEAIEGREDLSDLECAYAQAMREGDEARVKLAEVEAQAAALRDALATAKSKRGPQADLGWRQDER